MSSWTWIFQSVFCLLALRSYEGVAYRVTGVPNTLNLSIRNQRQLWYSLTANEGVGGTPPSQYLVVQPPLKALWDVISEYVVPLCHSESNDGKAKPLPILLSCSGGQDSMAMLHALGLIKRYAGSFVRSSPWGRIFGEKDAVDYELIHQTLRKLLANVHVVYFDHRVRDDTSKDIDIIRSVCSDYGFDFTVEAASASIVDLGRGESSGNFQGAAREWRRDVYKRLIIELPIVDSAASSGDGYDGSAESAQIFNRNVLTRESDSLLDKHVDRAHFHRGIRGVVLLAHHANDNVETFVFKLLRGVHVSNLSGIERICYLDDDKDIVIARPYLRLTKAELGSFLENVGGTYCEDSSNSSSKYLRNRIRRAVVPELLKATSNDNNVDTSLKGLDKRFCTISAQSRAVKKFLDLDTYMFSKYVATKYNLPNRVMPPQEPHVGVGGHAATDLSHLEEAYSTFYSRMYAVTYGNTVCEKTRRYIRTLQFLRNLGFNTKEVLLIREWLLVQSELTRQDILYKFILRELGNDLQLDYSALERISLAWFDNPVSDMPKMHSLRGDRAMCHQGSMVKICRPTSSAIPASECEVYDDGRCSFRVFDNFTATVTPYSAADADSGFHLKLSVPHEGAGGRPAAYDIRKLRDDDIVPCDTLWNRKAASVLAKMNFPHILKDELPVVAVRDSNQVVCFYGVNVLAPYYVNAPQHVTVSFGKDAAASRGITVYYIRVTGK
ncbi:tRNA(Ile)-lysidine synthetase [Babesia ovata]|uniref:tRNA(Ile)-lysidine synthetase n=1 Tax=Babesia ovata TaxID=189622 RepID=A0A2H6KH97_9APIC|nr:tRNA(Ile)-lysidine synthetase [Babesia ovata]GBE62363.1 tRNA(Ile)-lysidine synthetase [Babesia ovata]